MTNLGSYTKIRHPLNYAYDSMDQQWQIDLAFMKKFNGICGFLLAIDLLSQFCWTRRIQSKKTQQIKAQLASIFEEAGTTPQMIRSDAVSLFYHIER